MTALATRPVNGPSDVRRAGRILAAVVLPIGPVAVAVLRFILPYQTTDSSAAVVKEVAAHQSAENAVVWLGLLAAFTMVPAAIWACRVVGRQAPRLAAAAVLLMVPGYLSLGWLGAGDATLLFGVQHGIAPATLAAMYGELHPAAVVAEAIFVLGHVLGTVLLAIALIRTRVVPLWAGVATLVAQPLHFVAAVIVGSHALDLTAWSLNVVGFAAISLVILATPDDDWALPPKATSADLRRSGMPNQPQLAKS